jgi:hypothetical protein
VREVEERRARTDRRKGGEEERRRGREEERRLREYLEGGALATSWLSQHALRRAQRLM